MKLSNKLLTFLVVFFLLGNIGIYFSRNAGFDYIKYPSLQYLYPLNADSSFFQKWTKYNKRFSAEELTKGLQLVKHFEDSASTDSGKAVSIAAWLYNSFNKQIGTPEDTLNRLSPLLKYKYLLANQNKQLWCGQFQEMFGFFCTAAGLKNRYVELVPKKGKNNIGYHEVNEVWFSEIRKWVMVDVTRNILLVSRPDQVFSAAEYLDYNILDTTGTFFRTSVDNTVSNSLVVQKKEYSYDDYFNINYSLRYYLTMQLSDVYSPFQKLKRYFIPNPWFEMYDQLINIQIFISE